MRAYNELLERERNELAYEALKVLARKFPDREDIWFGPQEVANQIRDQHEMYPVYPNYVRDALDFLFDAGKISAISVYRTKRGEKDRVDAFLRFYRSLPGDFV